MFRIRSKARSRSSGVAAHYTPPALEGGVAIHARLSTAIGFFPLAAMFSLVVAIGSPQGVGARQRITAETAQGD